MREFLQTDANLYGYGMDEQKMERLPEKIKQMGGVEGQVRIFVEDYVYTYLYQYGKSDNAKEKVAALVGRHLQMNGQEAIIISGAIQGKASKNENGVVTFSDETWEYIGSQMEIYFKGMELVGWVHLQPGFGSLLMTKDEVFHGEYFKESWQVLFVLDCQDRIDTFYIYGGARSGLRQARGYFIYYDRNQEMQEYMLENTMVKPRVMPKEAVGEVDEKAEEGLQPKERMDAAADIRRVLKKRAREAEEAQKHRYTMLVGVSGTLCVVCLCMGFALFSGMSRLQSLEGEFLQVQNSYEHLAASMEGVRIQTVFAQESETIDEMAVDEEEEERVHEVQSGESLYYISRMYYGDNDGIERIMDANDIANPDKIFVGQVLRIPQGGADTDLVLNTSE